MAFKIEKKNPLEGFFFLKLFRHITTPSGDKRHYKNIIPLLTLATVNSSGSDVEGITMTSSVSLEFSAENSALTVAARLHINSSVPARTDYSFNAVIEISQRVCLKQKLIVV